MIIFITRLGIFNLISVKWIFSINSLSVWTWYDFGEKWFSLSFSIIINGFIYFLSFETGLSVDSFNWKPIKILGEFAPWPDPRFQRVSLSNRINFFQWSFSVIWKVRLRQRLLMEKNAITICRKKLLTSLVNHGVLH